MPIIMKKAFKLRFEGPLHLAKGKADYGESEQILHSDTLKSALFVCARQLYGEEIDAGFLDAFTISSAFPYFREEFFFPKPMVRIQKLAGLADEKQGKKLKRIGFLGRHYFEDLLNGAKEQIPLSHLYEGGRYVSNQVHLADREVFTIFRSTVQQRVAIAYDYSEDPRPYYVERLFFGPDAGLFFLVDCPNEAVYRRLVSALKLLGDNGIGTDRNVGNGQFTFEETRIRLQCPDRATHQLNLSLYCPQQEELSEDKLAQSAYSLVKRGGYLSSPAEEANITLRKRSVYMFAEGSVFPNGDLLGKLVDLRPEIATVAHPVWREGRALFLPINPAT